MVSKINIMQTTAINSNVCPRVLFTGLKVHYKELELTFGDYEEVFNGTENTSKTRMIPCITLYPCANATQTWWFMNIITQKRVCRSQMICMNTTQLIIDKINNFDGNHTMIGSVDLQTPTPSQLKVEKLSISPSTDDPEDMSNDVLDVINRLINLKV